MFLSKRGILTTVACALPTLSLHLNVPVQVGPRTLDDVTCGAIAAVFHGSSVSDVLWPGSQNYTSDNEHYSEAIVQASTCSAEPGTPEDVGKILNIVASMRTPFAVKSGGHNVNPGFSSTPGVQISMSRFADVTYDPETQTARVGAGLKWKAVYVALAPYNVSAVGGRNPGVGVGGLLLGGGYSYKTNQVGLGIDNIVSMETVLPNGTVVNVTAEAHPDLWFALRGGGNNFGIVTNFVLKTQPQSAVWGGAYTYGGDQVQAVMNATAKFAAESTDPKAQIIVGFGATSGVPGLIATGIYYYDAPVAPAGVFDDFLAIPSLSDDAGTKSLVDYLGQDAPVERALFESMAVVNYTLPLLQAIVDEVNRTSITVASANASFFGAVCEPFLPSILTHGSASAWPSQRGAALMAGDITALYTNASADALVHETVVAAGLKIREAAAALGQSAVAPDSPDAPMYPNYAAWGTPLEQMYGQNLPRLKEIKRKYDPADVMGLAGGFKITL